MTSSSSLPELGYWKIRGLASPIRMLLSYVKEEYVNTMYDTTLEVNPWVAVKEKLGLSFPNLPYYLDGPVKVIML